MIKMIKENHSIVYVYFLKQNVVVNLMSSLTPAEFFGWSCFVYLFECGSVQQKKVDGEMLTHLRRLFSKLHIKALRPFYGLYSAHDWVKP